MKKIILVTQFLSAIALSMPGISDGVYRGKGRMKTPQGLDSTYDASLTVKENEMVAYYNYGGGKEVSYSAKLKFTSKMEFEILEDDKSIGTGYCENGMCHLDVPGHNAEETIFFENGSLLRLGSMKHGDTKLIYTEKLSLMPHLEALSEKVVLECEGFEHSDTVKVRVLKNDKAEARLIEISKTGAELSRVLKAEEISAETFSISPIYDISRTLKKKEGQWILAYGCGEERPISCQEF
ncbi:MAG: hypothetical protein EBQ92_02140 [Proteobacteria bacterium]|jgi:hypothetical protein|nr:hypothetical protein [Pseudomonadota bacterium]